MWGPSFNPLSLGCFLILPDYNEPWTSRSSHGVWFFLADCKWQSRLCLSCKGTGLSGPVHLCLTLLLGSPPRRCVLRIQGVMSLTGLTWCCRGHSRSGRSSAVCCLWWSRGSGPPSHWQRTDQVSRWSPTWMGPSPASHQGIRCRPAGGRSTAAAGRCWPCSPTARRQRGGLRVRPWIVTWWRAWVLPVSVPQSPFWRMLSECGMRCQVCASGKNQGSHNYPWTFSGCPINYIQLWTDII